MVNEVFDFADFLHVGVSELIGIFKTVVVVLFHQFFRLLDQCLAFCFQVRVRRIEAGQPKTQEDTVIECDRIIHFFLILVCHLTDFVFQVDAIPKYFYQFFIIEFVFIL